MSTILELPSITETEDAHLIGLYAKREIALVRGQGTRLWDSAGREYLDLYSNYGVNILGHAHPAVGAAIKEQVDILTNCHSSFYNDARARFLTVLGEMTPPALSRAFLSSSGAEAIEAALKFARVATGRPKVVAAKRGYHGRTLGALNATAEKKYRDPFLPLMEGFSHVAYDDIDALGAAVDEQTSAIILEPIQGEGGIYAPSDDYLPAALEIARRTGALLILDEIQSAFRTGALFACEGSGVTPDILCVSKGIANGFPLGVTLVTEEVAARIPAGGHGTTFGGNPLACAAGTATLTALREEGRFEQADRVGTHFMEQLRALNHPKIRDVRGRGLMIGVELRERATKHLRGLQERGIICLSAGATTLRFLPPLLLTEAEVDRAVATIDEVLTGGPAAGRRDETGA
ncbi:MAG: N-acetyl-lysine aminotransferase [uncultured Thermomicrobiales bacterium]|uniref:N-acetyl-lysine aminotransferase n=1 Tax=uncultured Thermomicrobiales bacterium TaxID=1645740 RepID=A0A6J4VQA0_9BACT|nr:MAG: N-acetyl-lysine aminotransferase [uncultured Thermomicrobiales bacterium]